MNVLLVDVCHTLYRSNTTFDFLAWYLKHDPDYEIVARRRKNILVRTAQKLTGQDRVRPAAIRCLQGHQQADLQVAATEFIRTLEPIKQTWDELARYRQAGAKIVLLSASLDFIVNAVAADIEADESFASRLTYDADTCLGVLSTDLTGRKQHVIQQHFAADACDFITDNRSDLGCKALVDDLIAVYRDSDNGETRGSDERSPMNRLIYYLPLAYFLATRLKTPVKLLSWIAILPVPLLMVGLLVSPLDPVTTGSIILLGITASYTVYELGYLQNDVVTVTREDNPTLRLSETERDFVRQHWLTILATRVLALAAFLTDIELLEPPGMSYYYFSLLLLVIVFPVYNSIRSWINVPLHFLLVCGRFMGPVLLVAPAVNPIFLGYLILIFPLLNVLERGAEPRYGITWLQDIRLTNQVSGRWIYYLVVSLVWLGVCQVTGLSLLSMSVLAYMLIYRAMAPQFINWWQRRG
jgi:phosphoserine phosphatase